MNNCCLDKNYDTGLKDKITVVVNSCDNYDDLWIPFFTLLKKYWKPLDVRVILNTETKNFSIDGMKIECIHPKNKNVPYGERMLNILYKVKTPYVIPFLDDFFLRKDVDLQMIKTIIEWMEKDKNIVYFNCDDTPVYINWDSKTYPGFHRIPHGNIYTLNMQAAVWRTDKLIKYWKPNVSPWEWEEFTNLTAARNKKDKFYCVSNYGNGFCDYGYNLSGMGVHKGKWVEDDVVPLFKKEGIDVDFSKRGFLVKKEQNSNHENLRDSLKTISTKSEMIKKCLDIRNIINYYFFVKRNNVMRLLKNGPDLLYIRYMLLKEKKRFLRRYNYLLNTDNKE